jgi:hypothetical protein
MDPDKDVAELCLLRGTKAWLWTMGLALRKRAWR